MKKRLGIILSIISVLMVACTDDFETNQKDEFCTQVATVDMELIKSKAENFFSKLGEETRTANREVESIEGICQAVRTRSAGADTLLYLVNYKDEQGYAIVGSKAYLEDVYAFSDSGHLNMSDTVGNVGLKEVLTQIQTLADIATSNSIIIGGPIVPTPERKYQLIEKCGPYVRDVFAKWAYGYNEYIQSNPKWIDSEVVGLFKIISHFADMRQEYWQFLLSESGEYQETRHSTLIKLQNAWEASGCNYNAFMQGQGFYPAQRQPVYVSVRPQGIDYFLKFGTLGEPIEVVLEEGSSVTVNPISQPVLVRSGTRDYLKGKDKYDFAAYVIDGMYKFAIWTETNKVASPIKNLCYYHCLWGTNDGTDGYYLYPFNGYYEEYISNPAIEHKGILAGNILIFGGVYGQPISVGL